MGPVEKKVVVVVVEEKEPESLGRLEQESA